MRVIRREWFDVKRDDMFRLYPIGDIHIGAAACDENRLLRTVDIIANDDQAYWWGQGDYCDFINRSDPRFSPATLASWIKVADLSDLAHAQVSRFVDIIKPIASKCLAMAEGNHETAITKHYERNVFSEIVTKVKEHGGFPADHQLGLGYSGYLRLGFHRSAEGKKRQGTRLITINLHHGYAGGRLAGGKALSMQRHLWTHSCDIAVFGHSHNTAIQIEAVEEIDGRGKVVYRKRIGAYAGSFLRTANEGAATYSEVKGYLPLPIAGVCVLLQPHANNPDDVLHVTTR